MANRRIKVAGYAQRIFFNDNIEYRDFSPDLVGFQLTSEGGTTLFTNGNFSISVNLDPKPDILFKQGTKSKFYTLDDIATSATTQFDIQKNIRTKLNLDLTNPLSYIWYGSAKELVRSSLIEIQEKWPAAIYVDNKVGSVTGNNITNYVYDIEADESTFTVNSNFFINPYVIKYTTDAQYVSDTDISNPLRNFTLKYDSYVIEHNGISRKIKNITPAPQKTNSNLEIVVEGNPFPELTGIFIPQLSFLFNNVDASIPYFIKPNEDEIEKFFTGLNDLQKNILNRDVYPKYRSEVISSNYTDDGVLLTSKSVLDFPVLADGYNLNFFDSFYIAYLDSINRLGEGLDESKTDIIVRKYTTEAISSFDTIPRADGDDLVLNGEKATKLLRIYGVEFDYIKKYINGIKFAHVVTYNKQNNIPDSLVKDLGYMLGLEPINFINDTTFSKLFLPSNGAGQFSGTSVNLTQSDIDIELYRRLILNVAWLWKSKGSRKAVEFLFRFIGAPESLVNFNEYIVMVDKPLDIEEIKKLLYLYTGEVNLENIPYDENGFPLPPTNGELVITDFINPETGELVENSFTEMYFQKGGGWYRETYGSNVVSVLNGNNPHIGKYDGGNEYLKYFSRCYIPNFNDVPSVTITADTLVQNYFLNYNYGIFNGIDNNSEIYTTQLTLNPQTNGYQPINDCLNINYSIIETPLQSDGSTTFQQQCCDAEQAYFEYLELIKLEPYLAYSPEWQVIKNNYEISKNNCLTEAATENCDINKTLQICLDKKEKEKIQYSCNNLNLVECSPFIYYTNDDGIKVSFDEFPTCCRDNEGAKFVSYVNEYGRTTEYCSKLAPCVGKPQGVDENGYVVFSMDNNTMPKDIVQISFNQSTIKSESSQPVSRKKVVTEEITTTVNRCFQYIYKDLTFQDFFLRLSAEEYIETYIYTGRNLATIPFEQIFVEVSCNATSIVSSPECCAWYGYGYEIIQSKTDPKKTARFNSTSFTESKGDTINVVDTRENSYIVCTPKNKINTPEDIKIESSYTTPFIDKTTSKSYEKLQNPVVDVYNYNSTEIFWDCFNESRIVKGVVSDSTSLAVLPYSILQDPELMNPKNWEVFSIDEYGRVSFTPKIYNNNFILDWYSDQSLNDLYKQIAEYYGYQFGLFTFDYSSDTLIPYNGDSNYSTTPNSTFSAAIDTNLIPCDEVNNVSVVFASEKWKGFKLPELDDCSCTIDFSFDYMLKYEAKNLIECADNITCFPAIIYDNTITNINCLNFVAFTNSEEESKNLEINFNDILEPTEEYIIWQNTNILEPNTDCCIGIGGNVVSFNEWASSNQLWVNTITQNYNTLSNSPTLEFLNSLDFNYSDMLTFIKEYESIKNDLIKVLGSCYNINFDVKPCEINYGNYITTQNVCSLQMPLECGLWSKIYSNYEKLNSELRKTLENVLKCAEAVGVDFFEEPYKEVVAAKEFNFLTKQKVEQTDIYTEQETSLRLKLQEVNNAISEKESENLIIQKAITNVDNSLDCSIYENKINEINNFDYKNYCNSIVYGTLTNDGTKTKEYDSCVSSKIAENEKQKLIYSDLLNLCITKNQLNEQLVKAKFDNNLVLVSELEKQIQSVTEKINTLTTDANNFISFDESTQKSDLSINDTQNTINKTAEILNVNPEKITDKSGNLVLTDSQKLKLNINLTKNESQISTLESEKSLLDAQLKQTTQNRETVQKNTEQQQDVLRQAAASGGKGPGGGQPTVYGCTLSIGTYEYDYANGYKYLIQSQSGPTPAGATMDPSYYSSQWTPIQGTNPQLYQRGTCYAFRSSIMETAGSGALPPKDNTTTAVEVLLPTDIVTFNKCDIPADSIRITTDGIILSNGNPISQECCSKEFLNFEASYINKQCIVVKTFCEISQNSLSITPEGIILSNGRPISEECCNRDVLNTEVTFIEKQCRVSRTNVSNCCNKELISLLNEYLKKVEGITLKIDEITKECYDKWYNTLIKNYSNYEQSNTTFYLDYLDDLKINFKLFVDNNNIDVVNAIDTSLTYLPYTQSVNPIWEFNPTSGYTGILLEGDEQLIAQIEDSIFNQLSSQNIPYNSDIFEPNWKTFKFRIPECVCDDLRRLYPNKEFFFSIEIENYECSVCLLVDNILVNVSDCKTQRILSINDCMVPQLSCVIDNKKSWVYYDGGVVKETIYPNGQCNTGSTTNYEIVKLKTPEERIWTDLEYRYTNYDVFHSDLILNVKNTSFSIDPAKSIECDVFNYWKNIDCNNCPTGCGEDNYIFQSSEDYIFQQINEDYIFQDQLSVLPFKFNGTINSSLFNGNYQLILDDTLTTGLPFSCETYTELLHNQIIELKNEYYLLTANYTEALDAGYYDLLEKGGSLSKFFIERNSCEGEIIVLNDTNGVNNLFGLIVEKPNGTLGFFETYVYTGTPLYVGGVEQELINGVSAQTFNQSNSITKECCNSISNLLNHKGTDGLGLDKSYHWSDSESLCYWRPINECSKCKGDCEYCGKTKKCISGQTSIETYNVCINPLDFLDFDPSTIKVKDVFDQLVLSNLIDAKSRQTISDYPLLRLFYELYLKASNCGSDLSGKFTYDTMFEFMDKIGDYWLDLLEQVVPATTIWEGCDNSGKIYRNTIFDQNKFKYKKYSLNFIDIDEDCPLSAKTDFSIGQQSIYSLVEQKPIYPTSDEINSIKNEIRNREIELAIAKQKLNILNGRLCSLNLQDLNTPNLDETINSVNSEITETNNLIETLNTILNNLFFELSELEKEYLEQQQNYLNNFMSCTGITQSLINAENKLCSYIPGTTAYERQRNFIAGLRDKYDKCIAKSNTLVTDYNTVFITQIYDSNEYEGNVTIIGDPDWEEGGPFYNKELIHNC